jgi:hypothetical protein
MKRVIIITILSLFCNMTLFAQAAWIEPNPVNVNDSVTILIDVSQPDCECPLLLNLDAEGDSLFLWTWEPTENATINNGQWNASNLELKMTSEGNNIWSYRMVPTSFYNVDASEVYDIGLSFLVKKFDGSATPDGEPKSADLHVDVDPLGCVDRVCAFPQKFKEDDYLTIIYDNTLETHPGLQNISEGDCYFLPVAVADGVEYKYLNVEFSQDISTSNPELLMSYEGDGKFASTILSEVFFRAEGSGDNPVPDGIAIEKIKIRFRKSTFTGNLSLFSELTVLICP